MSWVPLAAARPLCWTVCHPFLLLLSRSFTGILFCYSAVLAGRLSSGTSTGTVYVGGTKRRSRHFKHIAKYVPQEDNLYGTMSVKETLRFSAELSLPENVTERQREERVNAVLQDLGTSPCTSLSCA